MNKADFQLRVLRKYGFLPVFEGEVPSMNVRGHIAEDETLSQWTVRVLGISNREVKILTARRQNGNKQVRNLAQDEGKETLRAVLKAQAGRSLQKGIKAAKLENTQDVDPASGKSIVDSQSALVRKTELIARVKEISENYDASTQEFLKRLVNDQKENVLWEDIFEELVQHYSELISSYKRSIATQTNAPATKPIHSKKGKMAAQPLFEIKNLYKNVPESFTLSEVEITKHTDWFNHNSKYGIAAHLILRFKEIEEYFNEIQSAINSIPQLNGGTQNFEEMEALIEQLSDEIENMIGEDTDNFGHLEQMDLIEHIRDSRGELGEEFKELEDSIEEALENCKDIEIGTKKTIITCFDRLNKMLIVFLHL